MPNSAVRTFSDPWEYQASFPDADVRTFINAAGRYESSLTRIELHQLELNRGQISLPRVAYSAHNKDLCKVSFLTDADQAPTILNGMEVFPDQIVFHSLGADLYNRNAATCRWGSVCLTPGDLAAAGRAIVDNELTAPAVTRPMRLSPFLLLRFLNLHKAAGRLAETVPDILAHPEVSRAIEQELLHALVRCLAEGLEVEPTSSRGHRQPVMRRFEQFLQENVDHPIYLSEACAAMGVSDRTLRLHCEEHLGMGPQKYLWLRRMNLAHKSLASADPKATSVTAIALDHGFTELGRFAVAYRKLFGVTPSATLRSAFHTLARNEKLPY